jgi:hypothetical protein
MRRPNYRPSALATGLAMHLYVLPTLFEVQRELYGTYCSRQSHHLASQGEARLLFTHEQTLQLAKSGIPAGGTFAMVNAEGMMARDEKVSQQFEDALQDVIKFRAL